MLKQRSRNNSNLSRRLAILGTIVALFVTVWTPSPGLAQEASTEETGPAYIQEIVVTAQRREQNVQDVPIAITAFSTESLESLGVKSTDQLANFTPNLTWNASGVIGSTVGIRGVVDNNFTTNQVGSVAIVVDEVGLNSPVLNTVPVFDLQRIEVLRGPQVTLYGRSTTGGAINFVTRRPEVGGEFNGIAEVSYGDFGQVDIEGAVGAPVGASAAVRLAGVWQTRDGIYSNPTQSRDVGERDRQGLRLSLAAKPTDSFSIYANLQYGRDRGDGPYYKNVGTRNTDGTPCAPTSSDPGGPCVDGAGFRDTASYDQNFADAPSFQRIDVAGGLVNVVWRFAGVSLTSITSYFENEYDTYQDLDGGPFSLAEVHVDTDTDQAAQELRLASDGGAGAKVDWIAGLFYFEESQDGFIAQVGRVLQNAPPPGPIFRSMRYEQDNTIASAYGQIDWQLTDQVELTLGARYSSEEKEGEALTLRHRGPTWVASAPPVGTYVDRARALTLANPGDSSSAPTLFGKEWNNSGGKAGLNWKPNDDTLIYGSISRGFKGGTFNFVPAVDLTGFIAPLAPANFQAGARPEELTTYELGTKLDLFDRSLRLNIALFRNDYTDQHAIVFQGGGPVLVNAAASTTDGLEIEASWLPGDGWNVQAGLGLLDAKYDDFLDPSTGANYAGEAIVQASDVTANGLVQKTWTVGNGSVSVQGSFKYSSDNFATTPYVPLTHIDSRTLFDARIAYALGADEAWVVSLWGKNLSDERYCTTTGEIPWGMGQCAPYEPRTFGVRLRAAF